MQEVLQLSENEQKLINEFAKWIDDNGNEVGYRYRQLSDPEDYFCGYKLCGVFKIKGDKPWLFVHQECPEPGDHPAAYLYNMRFSSLEETIEDVENTISLLAEIKNTRG
ncbi:MAG: hypothetical protein J5802_09155 [Butyrivibrio sp.]|nr:hypothetical protein [Butyrivibrio sp.]